MIIKTFNLTAGKTNKVELTDEHSFFIVGYAWVINNTSEDVYISLNADMAAESDGTAKVSSGSIGMLDIDGAHKNLYAIGNGKIEVRVTSEAICPFKSTSKGGEATSDAKTVNGHTVESDVPADAKFTDTTNSDITATGNPVQIDGLQGGVPFSEITVSGKNLLKYPYMTESGKVTSGVTFTANSDGSITLNGTSTAYGSFNFTSRLTKDLLLNGTYTLSGATADAKLAINATRDGKATTIIRTQSSSIFTTSYHDNDNEYGFAVFVEFDAGKTFDNLTIFPQLELGSTPTAYEPPITGRELTINVNGTDYTITPDSNPYIVPNDIRQQDGLNVVSVSGGTLSVTGCKDNAAIKRIWDSVGMDLLFDGITSADAPAVIDTIDYKSIMVSSRFKQNNYGYITYPILTTSDLNYFSDGTPISLSIGTSSAMLAYITKNDKNIWAVHITTGSGLAVENTQIYGIKE